MYKLFFLFVLFLGFGMTTVDASFSTIDQPTEVAKVLGFGEPIRSGLAAHYNVMSANITVVKIANRSYTFSVSGGDSGSISVVLEGMINKAYVTSTSGTFVMVIEDNLDPF